MSRKQGANSAHKAEPMCSVVLCGSYRKAQELLAADYESLRALGCDVLSPADIRFTGERDGFVFAHHERDISPASLEQSHLLAISAADFVWLHAPDGYLGRSGAVEVGFAHAQEVPVFGREAPSDVALRGLINTVDSPKTALAALAAQNPQSPRTLLQRLQRYYEQVARLRGYDSETPQDSMLLLTEEIGELARAVRKHVGLAREGGYIGDESVATELADVQLYVLHLANLLNVNLSEAVQSKEAENARRFAERVARLSA